jgi:3-oxoacyl-[acyl-carrier-protein] synthase-1
MKLAIDGFPARARRNAPVDYINTHGTSTPVGDITELDAIRSVSATSCRPSARPSR